MFLSLFRNILCPQQMFPSLRWKHNIHFVAHERVRVQNGRDFRQTELDREVNAPFLLSDNGT